MLLTCLGFGRPESDGEREIPPPRSRPLGVLHRAQRSANSLDIDRILASPQSPRQNAVAERVIGSIRRECLDHVILLSEGHFRRILTSYFHSSHR